MGLDSYFMKAKVDFFCTHCSEKIRLSPHDVCPVEIGYWRKNHKIHQWMIERFKKDPLEMNFNYLLLEKEDLLQFKQDVIDDKLPYGEVLLDDKDNLLSVIKSALTYIKYGDSIFYYCSF